MILSKLKLLFRKLVSPWEEARAEYTSSSPCCAIRSGSRARFFWNFLELNRIFQNTVCEIYHKHPFKGYIEIQNMYIKNIYLLFFLVWNPELLNLLLNSPNDRFHIVILHRKALIFFINPQL